VCGWRSEAGIPRASGASAALVIDGFATATSRDAACRSGPVVLQCAGHDRPQLRDLAAEQR